MEQKKDKKGGKVRFIRVNGRVVPIRDKKGTSKKQSELEAVQKDILRSKTSKNPKKTKKKRTIQLNKNESKGFLFGKRAELAGKSMEKQGKRTEKEGKKRFARGAVAGLSGLGLRKFGKGASLKGFGTGVALAGGIIAAAGGIQARFGRKRQEKGLIYKQAGSKLQKHIARGAMKRQATSVN